MDDTNRIAQRGRASAQIFRNARPTFAFRLLIWFSAALATLGLIADQPTVVIGSMLIAPLLGPMLAISEGILGGRRRGLQFASLALLEGVVTAIVISLLVALFLRSLPLDWLATIPGEVDARTRPNLVDLGIALAGGTVGAFVSTRTDHSDAIPGVAIATALMPPLCTIGIGFAMGDSDIWSGASLLFLTNLCAIIFAGSITFTALGFAPRHGNGIRVTGVLALAPVVVLGVVLFGLTYRAVSDDREADGVRSAATQALDEVLPGAHLVEVERINGTGGELDLRLTARTIGTPSTADALLVQALIAQQLQRSVALTLVVIPTLVLSAVEPPDPDQTVVPTATPPPTNIPTPTAMATASATPTPSPTATPPPSTPTPRPSPTVPATGSGGLAR